MANDKADNGWLRDIIDQAKSGRGAGSNRSAPTPSDALDNMDISSGMPAMDALHHEFFQALDELSCVPDAEFGAAFTRFVAHVEQVFDREDAWMEDIELPALRAHREQHARVLGALHNVHMRVAEGNLGLGREVTEELLPQWLALHMSTMDKTLAHAMLSRHPATMQSRGLERPASPH